LAYNEMITFWAPNSPGKESTNVLIDYLAMCNIAAEPPKEHCNMAGPVEDY